MQWMNKKKACLEFGMQFLLSDYFKSILYLFAKSARIKKQTHVNQSATLCRPPPSPRALFASRRCRRGGSSGSGSVNGRRGPKALSAVHLSSASSTAHGIAGNGGLFLPRLFVTGARDRPCHEPGDIGTIAWIAKGMCVRNLVFSRDLGIILVILAHNSYGSFSSTPVQLTVITEYLSTVNMCTYLAFSRPILQQSNLDNISRLPGLGCYFLGISNGSAWKMHWSMEPIDKTKIQTWQISDKA